MFYFHVSIQVHTLKSLTAQTSLPSKNNQSTKAQNIISNGHKPDCRRDIIVLILLMIFWSSFYSQSFFELFDLHKMSQLPIPIREIAHYPWKNRFIRLSYQLPQPCPFPLPNKKQQATCCPV